MEHVSPFILRFVQLAKEKKSFWPVSALMALMLSRVLGHSNKGRHRIHLSNVFNAKEKNSNSPPLYYDLVLSTSDWKDKFCLLLCKCAHPVFQTAPSLSWVINSLAASCFQSRVTRCQTFYSILTSLLKSTNIVFYGCVNTETTKRKKYTLFLHQKKRVSFWQ